MPSSVDLYGGDPIEDDDMEVKELRIHHRSSSCDSPNPQKKKRHRHSKRKQRESETDRVSDNADLRENKAEQCRLCVKQNYVYLALFLNKLLMHWRRVDS